MTNKADWFIDQTSELVPQQIVPGFDNKNFDVLYYPNKYTGEVLPYKTVASVEPDKGVKNTGKDLCRKEDFEPLSAVIARFFRSGRLGDGEFQYTSDDVKNIDNDNLTDAVDPDADILDQAADYTDYMEQRRYASDASVSAGEAEEVASDERPQVSEEQATPPAEAKPSE